MKEISQTDKVFNIGNRAQFREDAPPSHKKTAVYSERTVTNMNNIRHTFSYMKYLESME